MHTNALHSRSVYGGTPKLYELGEIGALTLREGEGGDPAEKGGKPAASAGGSDAGNKGGSAPRTYTDEDLNKIIARTNEKWEQKLNSKLEELAPKLSMIDELKQQSEEYKRLLEESTKGAENEELDPIEELEQRLTPPAYIRTEEGRRMWRLAAKKELLSEQRIAALTDEVSAFRKTAEDLKKESEERAREREQARAQAIQSDRSARMSTILGQLGVVDMDIAEPWLDRRVSRDEKAGRWVFRVDEDTVVPLTKDNVDKYLPASLRKPAVDAGGSGASGGRQTPTAEAVSALRAKLDALLTEAKSLAEKRQPVPDRVLAETQRLKREIATAERAQAA